MTDYYTCRDCHGYIFTCGCRERKEPVIAVMQSERTTFEALNSALRFAASRSAITSAEELAIMAAWNARASDAEITRLTEALCFIGKWVERGVFDKQISGRESLEVIINLPGMPWNSARWDVDHKPYAAAYYARFPAALKGPSHGA